MSAKTMARQAFHESVRCGWPIWPLQMTLLTVSNLEGAQTKRKESTFRRLSIFD